VHRTTAAARHPRITSAGLGLAGTIVVIAAIIAALPVAFPLLSVPPGADSVFVHTSLDLIGVGVTMATIVTFGVLLEPFSVGEPDDAAARRDAPLRRRS
jgi:hypothetical protein